MTLPLKTTRSGPGTVGSYAVRKAQKRKYAEAAEAAAQEEQEQAPANEGDN